MNARTKSFAGETWAVEAGRSIVTPDGHFYLTYGKDDKTSAPHYRDFCKLDDIAASMPLLPQIDRMRAALERIASTACDHGPGDVCPVNWHGRRSAMIRRVIAQTRVNARLYLAADGRMVTANRKREAASYDTIEHAEDAIRKHVHPAHYDRWEVAPDWRHDSETTP